MAQLTRRRLARYIAAELQKQGDHSALLQKVAAYLVVHNMSNQLDLLVHDVLDIFAKEYGVVAAEVVSARELSSSVKKQIETFIKQQTDAKTVQMSESVDNALIGGVVIRTPNAEYDSSIRTTLKQLKV